MAQPPWMMPVTRMIMLESALPKPISSTASPSSVASQNIPARTYKSSNELTPTSTTSYRYDDDGSTRTRIDSTGTTTYNWDFENRLVSVQLPNSSTVSFKYDPLGRRIQKSSTSTTNYVYDGANVIEEADQSGNILARYSQSAGIDEPLSELRSGATNYYEQDGLGSVTSLSSIGGSLVNTYVYDSFGNLSNSSGTVINPYQYTGRDYDSETGLRYYRARYYEANSGRFLSEDPAGFTVDVSFYRYAFNRSTNFIDSNGYSALPAGQAPSAQPPCPFNVDDFIDYLDSHAESRSQNRCTAYVRRAIEAGFGQNPTEKGNGTPVPAKDWGPYLVNNLGFVEIEFKTDANGDVNYEPVKGDIVVFQPVEGSNKNGHIEAFDGTQFVSDYKQGVFLKNGVHFFPNFSKNGPQPFEVYRYPCK